MVNQLINGVKSSLHVLIIAQYFYPDIGGASTRAYNMAQALKLQGANVTVVTAFPHYPHGKVPLKYKGKILIEEQINDVKTIRTWIPSLPHSSVKNRILLHLLFILSSLAALRRVTKPDIIIAMNPNLFAFYSAIMYSFIFRRKIIRNVDDLWPEVFYDLGLVKSRLAKKVLDLIAKISYSHTASVIPVSSGYTKTLTEKYKVPAEKITIIEQGVDVKKFKRRTEIGSGIAGKKIVMYSGALTEGYDFESLIQAARMLQREPLRFVIRGTGALYEDILRSVKDDKVLNLDLSNDILSTEELVALMNTADIFVLPMNSGGVIDEGLPTKILEYQALGKPIVCISAGEPGRYILRCKSGLVVAPNQVEDLAMSIKNLAKDEALSKELGDNGYKHVMNNLTFEKLGERLLNVIMKSLGQSE